METEAAKEGEGTHGAYNAGSHLNTGHVRARRSGRRDDNQQVIQEGHSRIWLPRNTDSKLFICPLQSSGTERRRLDPNGTSRHQLARPRRLSHLDQGRRQVETKVATRARRAVPRSRQRQVW